MSLSIRKYCFITFSPCCTSICLVVSYFVMTVGYMIQLSWYMIHDTVVMIHDTWYMIHDTNVMIHDTVVMIQWGFDYGCSTDRKFWLIDFNFFQNKMAMESCAPGLDPIKMPRKFFCLPNRFHHQNFSVHFSGFLKNFFCFSKNFARLFFIWKNFLKTENFNRKQKIFLVLGL